MVGHVEHRICAAPSSSAVSTRGASAGKPRSRAAEEMPQACRAGAARSRRARAPARGRARAGSPAPDARRSVELLVERPLAQHRLEDLGGTGARRGRASRRCRREGRVSRRAPCAVVSFGRGRGAPQPHGPPDAAAGCPRATGRHRRPPAPAAALPTAGRRPPIRAPALERRDAVLGRGMGGEQVVHARAGQRVDDEHVRGRRIALGGRVRDRCAAPRSWRSAEASHIGWPLISAPSSSAAYSRVRLIAICTSMAAIGARITMAIVPMMPSRCCCRGCRRRRSRTARASRSRRRSSR